jgi:hypothetical protein
VSHRVVILDHCISYGLSKQNIGHIDNILLFFPVRGFQDCMEIQSDLNKYSEWCERSSFFLNVDKCKTITFTRTRYPDVREFSYMIAETLLDQVKLYKRSGSHHGRENEFFGACGRHD